MRGLMRNTERAVDALAVVLFIAMFAVVILQVVLRYVFNRPLVFTDELASYLFVWVSFLGWTIATRKRVHIGIGVIADRLPSTLRRALHAFWCLATIAFAALLLFIGVAITRRNADVQMISLDYMLWPVYLAVPVSALLLIVYGLRDFMTIVRRGDIRTTEAQL